MKKLALLLLLILTGTAGLMAQGAAPALSFREQQLPGSVELAYTEGGEENKETILFLHGLGGSREHWQQNLPELAEQFNVLAVDLPGYGDSSIPAVPQDSLLYFFSDVLSSFLDSLSISKAHVVGHSMGGQLAMLFALEHPEQVQKLILAAPAGLETFTEAEAASLKKYAAATFPQKQPEAQIRMNYAMNFYQMPETAEQLIQDRLALNESEAFPAYAKILIEGVEGMLDTPLLNRLAEVEQPTLIVFGQEDRLIPNRLLHPNLTTEAVAQKGLQAIPESQLEIVPEAGHLLMYEKPEVFNELLIQFLNHTKNN
ncbi:alpha/beta fold hydrolase [Nafulsella turpanensis]|uniref:alpha/beta fold hydrolase n=1 Tax=Nafulsella turpanensis TaxID=1265690 RepID=UPI00034BAB74|nr:alpha/beta hydrolase [Nafulsella turpanensis]